ncbi:MAG TPA: TolC family protein, partial [Thermoanaerobaculia bacterium]|nr:TolC family protein [Thermoanaerobaculia bacterium]
MLFYLRIAAALLPAAVQGSSLEPALPAETGARLRAAIERAVEHNPEIGAMEARISAARHRVPQATALPDPEIEIGLKDVPVSNPSLTRDSMTMEMIMARQRLPGAGKLGVEERAARADSEGMEADHARHVAEVAADVADSFFRLAALDRKIAIARETLQRLADAAAAARERYRVGKAAQADVLRAHLDRTALEDRLSSLAGERRSEAARFNSLQDLPAASEVPAVDVGGDLESGIAAGPVPEAADLIRLAERDSPAVAVAAAGVRREEARVEGARLERRPDWMLQTYYGRRESFEDMAGVSVSFTLPWVHPRRLDEKKAEREAALSGAKATLAAVRNGLRRDIEQAWSDL